MGGAKLPTHPKSHKNSPLTLPLSQYVEQLLNFLFQPKKLVWRHYFADVSIFAQPGQHFYPKTALFGKTRIKFEQEVARGWLTPYFVAIELGYLSFEDGHNWKVA